MTTSPVTGTTTKTTTGTNSTSNTSGGSSNSSGGAYALSPSDFINLMITQLKNQDPLSPASNAELLTQMSQIGQLQSSTDLQTTMKAVTLQTQVGSASSLIGKTVNGISNANKSVTGTVDSVSVAGSTVNLNLDTGDTVAITNVSSISQAAAAGTGNTGGTNTN